MVPASTAKELFSRSRQRWPANELLSWPVSTTMEATSCDETFVRPRWALDKLRRAASIGGAELQCLHVWALCQVSVVTPSVSWHRLSGSRWDFDLSF